MVRARRAITRDGERAVAVAVTDGRIAAIESFESDSRAPRTVDLTDDEVLLPGMVDIPVHVNEPGRTEWEGFATATRPTAAGGVTTIIDTPLNSLPPTVDVAAPPSADNSPEPAPAVFGPVKRSLPNRPDPTRLRATPTATPEHSDIGFTCRRREPSGIDAAV